MRFNCTFFVVIFSLFTHLVDAQTGHVLNGTGAKSFGMAGIGTGYTTGPSTALTWSPASISKMPSTLEISTSLISLNPQNYSAMDLSVLELGPQGSILEGSLNDSAKDTVLPIISFVYNPDSRWSFGMTAAGIGGFGVNYESSASSPVSVLFGDIKSKYRLFQISLTAAYEITEKLSIGITPTFNIASLELTPISSTAPRIIDGLVFYPSGEETNARGYGFHVGLFYDLNEQFSFGMTYKSRQYFEDFEYDVQNGLGKSATTSLDYPMIVTAGGAFKGFKDFVFALEARMIDFSSTKGLGDIGYGSDLEVKGFGWENSYFFGFGAEYFLSEHLIIRSGYSYNTNPVNASRSFFSTVAPAVVQHAASLGSTYSLSKLIDVSVGYHHGFKATVEGPFILPSPDGGQPVPSLNRSSLATNVFSIDLTLTW